MKVYHLNCASIRPLSARLFSGAGRFFSRGRLISHCLLIESEEGLILVDTGLGMQDIHFPDQLGKFFLHFFKPTLDPSETALGRLTKLGFKQEDVRHIILTNLGVEKDGGLRDFPLAKVHVFAKEYGHAMARKTFVERIRYRPTHWSHHPDWILHHLAPPSQRWFGFPYLQPLPKAVPEILLVPLPGHTAGHCGVAVKCPRGWIFHCGNAYFSHKEMMKNPTCPQGLYLLQETLDYNHKLREHTQEKLRYLIHHHEDEVQTFCSSDPLEMAKLLRMRTDRAF